MAHDRDKWQRLWIHISLMDRGFASECFTGVRKQDELRYFDQRLCVLTQRQLFVGNTASPAFWNQTYRLTCGPTHSDTQSTSCQTILKHKMDEDQFPNKMAPTQNVIMHPKQWMLDVGIVVWFVRTDHCDNWKRFLWTEGANRSYNLSLLDLTVDKKQQKADLQAPLTWQNSVWRCPSLVSWRRAAVSCQMKNSNLFFCIMQGDFGICAQHGPGKNRRNLMRRRRTVLAKCRQNANLLSHLGKDRRLNTKLCVMRSDSVSFTWNARFRSLHSWRRSFDPTLLLCVT